MGISWTQEAAKNIRRQLDKRGHGLGLRLGVVPSGCSGFAYSLEYVDAPAADDQVFEHDGVRVYVAADDLPHLQGTELDYAREGTNEGFRFKNPNEKEACGCGESIAF